MTTRVTAARLRVFVPEKRGEEKKQEVAGASKLSEPRGCTPSCQPGLRSIPCAWLQGFEVEAVLIVESVRFSGGGLCFFSLAAGEGLKVGRGQGRMWHVGRGQGLFSLISLLFLEGVVFPCLIWPFCGITFAGHVSYWAPLHMSGAFEVVAPFWEQGWV